MKPNVVILGASNKPERFAYKAFQQLKAHDYSPILVSPVLQEIDGVKVFPDLSQIDTPVDTITVYVNSEISSTLINKILALKPRRIIFNPGSENTSVENALIAAGITVVKACTLVLLNSNLF